MAWTAPRTWTDGELVTASIMNTHVRDNELAIGPHLIVRKTADESVTSSTVLQNDDALVMAVAANEVWLMEWCIRYEAATTGDMKVAFTFPTAGEVNFDSIWVDPANAVARGTFFSTTSPTGSIAYGGAGAGNRDMFRISGVYVNGANAGNVQMQWAQNTSDGTATIVKANSTLWAVKLA